MKVIHLIFSFSSGGSENMLVDIINEQCIDESIELIIVNNFYDKSLLQKINNGVKIHFVNRTPGSKNPLYFLKVSRIIWKMKPDIIHCHSSDVIPFIFFKRNAKTCLTVHAIQMNLKYFGRYDRLFAISKAVKEDIKQRGNFKSSLVYNGIRFNSIRFDKKPSNSHFRIVQISRLNYKIKGQHIALKALNYLVHTKGLKFITIDFIGEKVFNDDKLYLEKLVKSYRLESNVNFLGLKDRNYIYNNLKDYDLLIQPSIIEGFGLTIVEAFAAKVPVLVSDTEGPMEIIEDGNYGNYFKANDSYDCAYKIEDILNHSKEEIDMVLNKSYKYGKEMFDIKSTARKYLNEYSKMLSNKW